MLTESPLLAAPPARRFEYKVEVCPCDVAPLQQKLNEMGAAGWRLSQQFTAAFQSVALPQPVAMTVLIFERPHADA